MLVFELNVMDFLGIAPTEQLRGAAEQLTESGGATEGYNLTICEVIWSSIHQICKSN